MIDILLILVTYSNQEVLVSVALPVYAARLLTLKAHRLKTNCTPSETADAQVCASYHQCKGYRRVNVERFEFSR